jgi:hypothetical protein
MGDGDVSGLTVPRLNIAFFFLLGVVAFAPSSAQARISPIIAFGPAMGQFHGGQYSTTSWSGLHVALSIPVYQTTSTGSMVFDFTRDVFWNGNGDDCVLAPPDYNRCLPDPPNLTAITIGWRTHIFGHRNTVLHLAAGRISGRGEARGGGFARLEFAPGSGDIGLQVFGQYALVPSFQKATIRSLLMGITVYYR